ncbi:MAG: ATP-binding protein, partial [Bacteroidota bacterium]
RSIAWAGPAYPRPPGTPPDSLVTRAVRDDASRSALAVWVPVGDTLGGAVRVVRVVQSAVPVRNQYLQDYDVAERWRSDADVPFDVQFGTFADAPSPLRGLDGRVVGQVSVQSLTPAVMEAQRTSRWRSIAAVWGLLLAVWLLIGLGLLVARQAGHLRVRTERMTRVRAMGALLAFWAGLAATRYGMLAADVPVRWLDRARRPAALFDPTLLASDFGAGALRSPGDLALSALFLLTAVVAGVAIVRAVRRAGEAPASRGQQALTVLALAGITAGSLALSARWIRQSVLDATLPYADQAGPLVDGPTLVVLAGLVALLASACLAISAAVGAVRRAFGHWWIALGVTATTAGALGALGIVPLAPSLGLAALACALAAVVRGPRGRWAWPLTFRGTLLSGLVLAPVLYGFMEQPMEVRTETLLSDAAFAFSANRDDRVTVALDQVFDEARADDALGPALLQALALADSARAGSAIARDSTREAVDALAQGLVTNSLLGSLADVATELRIVGPAGDILGSYVERGAPVRQDGLAYDALRPAYEDAAREAAEEGRARPRSLRSRLAVGERRGLPRRAAVGPILDAADETAAWLYLRVTPRTSRFPTETPFPRVLAPTGLFGLDDEALGYAEYDDGVLVRQRGAAPLRLSRRVYEALEEGDESLLNRETLEGRPTLVYYERQGDDAQDVVAVRAPAGDRFDTLFVLLRLSLAGLALGAVVFGIGLVVRRRAGLLPVERTRFRDKVLNRFLVVGLASVALTGVVGQRVIVEQNRDAVRDQLRQRLTRAAAVYASETETASPATLDAVSAALGVDVHLYLGADLEASSRRQLVRQRLIEPRLPGDVYRDLYLDDQPFAFSDDQIGTFAYTTGYLALPDESGRPAAALAIPTLSEQAAIEAGRARYVAFLFGGLLALLAAILVAAVLLASQLTRPFSRLREGLRRVGAGGAEEPIPVETQDEVGELVETFNAMQRDLAASRRQLAEQEREMAWSTMARQVAHEIKNPLMPMKLSVQHLQRTFQDPGDEAPPEERRFAGQFERTTDMLIDQIETLDRIASDFSRFARMPMRSPETLDLGEVAREAAALFEGPLAESGRAELSLDLTAAGLPVSADHEELRRVLVNLLTNALQAIPERPAPGHITLATVHTGDAVEARVIDDGTGIPPDVQERVFQPSFSTKTSGMGLGLAISKRAVEAAGGSITFETAQGAGTTFVVRLPLAAVGGDGVAAGSVPPSANDE